jgi:hypothetical protein
MTEYSGIFSILWHYLHIDTYVCPTGIVLNAITELQMASYLWWLSWISECTHEVMEDNVDQ